MLFNSWAYAVFLPAAFLVYWRLGRVSIRAQNLGLLAGSYLFYGWWDWRFLGLILISSGTDYAVGLGLSTSRSPSARRVLLATSLGVNLGLLGVFKYLGFFVESAADLLTALGFQANLPVLRLVLPVGISFYTFQTLGYTIDVFRSRVGATRDWVSFFAYVSFFPQLVAGPIERAGSLLPQFHHPRTFRFQEARDGLRQILWGLFKKVVIADNLAVSVDAIFAGHAQLDPLTLWLGLVFFAIQIYGDFSGYSDIALGSARLLGFRLMRNFAYPYFSRDIAEFWRRWHISLSSWFRDYLYIPLGGSRAGAVGHLRNVLLTFTISGIWHGANWTFVAWGALNGLYYVPLMIARRQHRHTGNIDPRRLFPRARTLASMLATFALTCVAWTFFRSDSITQAVAYLAGAVWGDWTTAPTHAAGLAWVVVLLLPEWVQRDKGHPLELDHLPVWARWACYYALVLVIVAFGYSGAQPFIYFQF